MVMASAIAGLGFKNEAEVINQHVAHLKANNVHTIVVLLHRRGL